MTVLLVRHAHAGDRDVWTGDDRQRPLTEKGQRQAHALVALLADYEIAAIFASPFARCVQTVEPLASAMGLVVRAAEALAEGHGAEGLQLRADQGVTVLCGHGDNVPAMLDAMRVEWTGQCQKASTWVVELGATSATYLPPPD